MTHKRTAKLSVNPEQLRARLEKARTLHHEHRRAFDDANALLRQMGGDPVQPIAEATTDKVTYTRNASWPRMMRVEHAADYVGEKSVDTFRRAIGTLYPQPIKVPGKGERWLKETLDQAIDKLSSKDDGPPLADLI